jgi:carboxymethylenebutenolidase
MVLSRRESAMEPTKPKLPREAIELYNDFIHGEISRRAFMEGIRRLAGSLAAATVINALMPNYALGQQVSRTDDRIKTTYETVPSPKGNGSIKGYLARPISADTRSETTTKLPGIIVVHENRKRLSRSGLDHLGMPGGREGAASPPSRQSPR